MPSYPKENESINLANFNQVKKLSNGKTNDVYLWEHKEDSNIKIVVKRPYGKNPDLIQHNLKAINAFFGAASAWTVQDEKAFAMKYYAGKPLLENEVSHFINDDNSPIRSIEKNGLVFTMLDPNEDNFLKLSSGEIIPIDFDYMIIHDNTQLLDYQEVYLDGRMSFAMKMGADTTEEAIKYVTSSYPKAHDYLLKQWGSKYINKAPQISPVLETPVLSPKTTKQTVKTNEAFVLADKLGNNFVDSIEVKNGNYIIIGRNSSGATRSIIIDKNGNATGYQGSKDLGIVGNQMYKQRAAIFEHFEIQVPAVVNSISLLSKVVEPCVAQITKNHVDSHKKQGVTFSSTKDTFFKSPIQTPVIHKVEPSLKSSNGSNLG